MKKITASLATVTLLAHAGGYKIPEQSLNSMALGAAYIAHTEGADTAYFNPAAMAFMKEGRYSEAGVTLAHLPPISYSLMPPYSGESKEENIPIPFAHYVGNTIDGIRWGVSITAPAGLSKRWDTSYQKLYAEEFTLKNVELNPVAAYKLSDNVAIGGGLRFIYSEGKVYSDGGSIAPIKREMEGSGYGFGYNAALHFKPIQSIDAAITYRSKVTIKEEGKANLYFGAAGTQYDASVEIPIPAALNVAIAKSWQDRFTLEFVYERTYWSAYEELDFEYETPITNPILKKAFDDPLARNWNDTDTFRIGATVKGDKLTVMFGYAVDETPVNEKYIGFELPDSDAEIFSMGFRYQVNKNLSWGMALLHDAKESRSLKRGVAENQLLANGGTFDEGGATLLTFGVSYNY